MFKDQFDDQVPSSLQFALEYYDSFQQVKVWLHITKDLAAMYSKYPKGGAINLWCDSNYDLSAGGGSPDQQRKRRASVAAEHSSYCKAREDESEHTFKNLREKYFGKFEIPVLCLLPRMIAAGIHDDYNESPDVSAFSNNKRACKETMSEVLQDNSNTTAQVQHQDLGCCLENVLNCE